jgi:CSLREA domain-containing protein
VVNSTLDTPNPDPTTGICADAQGRCTLRAAIQLVNYVKGTDTITLPAGIYKLTRPGYDDAALVGDLDIGVDLTIQGAGSGVTIVDGNGVVTGDRVFQILSTAKFTTLLTTLSPETEYLCVLPMMLLRWGRFQKTKRISIPIIQCFGVSTDGIYNTAGEWFGQKGSSWVY